MSGFLALINTNGEPVDRALLEKLTTSLHFKGPDKQQVWTDGGVGFGHALFRTTDESQYENQPASLDSKVWITGSIRIDAREELVSRLGISKQIKLHQTPDSELVLHAYHVWGDRCLDYLQGDFSFVIWDGHKRELFCARDRFGRRQLYYARKKDLLVIGNSLDAILAHPEITDDLNDMAIGGFLLFGDHNWLSKSITTFSDVNVLLPAHSLSVSNGRFKFRRYWELPHEVPLLAYRKESDYIDHFLEIFESAVSDRIRTPRVAISMSGGMDSSAVAVMAKKVLEKKYNCAELNAATIFYRKMYKCEEHHFSGLVANRLGLSIDYTCGDDFPLLSQGFRTTRPTEDEQPGLLIDFERKLGSFGRIVLTGAAADNLFRFPSTLMALKDGNAFHILLDYIKLNRRYGAWPTMGTGFRRRLRHSLSKKSNSSSYPFPSWIDPDFEIEARLKERWEGVWQSQNDLLPKHSRRGLLERSLLVPNWTTDDLFMDNKFPIGESVDPYLDLRMVEFALSLPAIPWLYNKDILRRSMEGYLPSRVISRAKAPLGVVQEKNWKQPENRWMDSWSAHPKLNRYIQRTKVPNLTGNQYDPSEHYVNLRPLLLNRWIEQTYNASIER